MSVDNTFFGSIFTDSKGIGTFSVSIDIIRFGIRTVNFYKVVIYNEGTPEEIQNVAMPVSYILSF